MGNRPIYYKGIRLNSLYLPDLSNKNSRIKKADRKRKFYNITFRPEHGKSAPKDLIVMYDIPHVKKKERDWFRRQLINFHYIMIQKSVWVGPSPLPREFVNYVVAIGLENKLKTFKLSEPYQGKGDPL